MDEATKQRLLAQWDSANKPGAVAEPSISPETNQKLIDRWNKREKYLKDTGGFGGGAQRFVDSAMNALSEPAIGVAQALGTADPKAVSRMRAETEHLTATPAGRLGNVVGSSVIPTAVGVGLPATLSKIGMAAMPVTRNAIGGAVSGAILPTLENESRASNIGMSTALSAGPSLAKKLFVQPVKPTAQAQTLIDEGIYPTPAQASGKLANAGESAATSIPFFGTAISNARTQPFREYVARRQKAFGYEGNKIGREATEEMGNISDEKYRNVVPKMMLEDTPDLRAKYLRAQQGLKPAAKSDVSDMLEFKFDPLVAKSPAKIIGGEDLNKWQSQLRERGERAAKSPDLYQQDLGNTYNTMREDTFNALENQGLVGANVPQEFRDARKYYAGMKDLMELGEAGSAAKRGGAFTPAEDLNWMKRNYGGSSSNAFGRNQVEDQKLAQAAIDTLGEVPDTGTAGRLSMLSFLKNPELGWGEKAIGLAALPFATQPARKFAAGGYDWQRAMGRALRDVDSPYEFPAIAPFTTELKNEKNRD